MTQNKQKQVSYVAAFTLAQNTNKRTQNTHIQELKKPIYELKTPIYMKSKHPYMNSKHPYMKSKHLQTQKQVSSVAAFIAFDVFDNLHCMYVN